MSFWKSIILGWLPVIKTWSWSVVPKHYKEISVNRQRHIHISSVVTYSVPKVEKVHWYWIRLLWLNLMCMYVPNTVEWVIPLYISMSHPLSVIFQYISLESSSSFYSLARMTESHPCLHLLLSIYLPGYVKFWSNKFPGDMIFTFLWHL